MNESSNGAPSSARILKATAIAVLVAAVFLYVVIEPSKRAPALAQTSQAAPAGTAEAPAATEPASRDDLAAIMEGNIRAAEPGVQKSYTEPFKSEVVKISMVGGEEVELKAHMQPGDTLLYSWTSPQPLYVDMHGEPFTYPEEPAVRYEEVDGVTSGNGRVTATFPGMNGWFWLNTSEEAIVIELKVSGYYEKLEEVYRKAP